MLIPTKRFTFLMIEYARRVSHPVIFIIFGYFVISLLTILNHSDFAKYLTIAKESDQKEKSEKIGVNI